MPRIIIYAKPPLPGLAKTRLAPELGAKGAAELARRLLVRTVEQALTAGVGPVELCVTPHYESGEWRDFKLSPELQWTAQGEGDLGERMAASCRRVLRKGELPMIIGTDCPGLDVEMLQMAAKKLARCDVCLGPVADGGYALIGLQRLHPSLFANIDWGTSTVMEATRDRIRRLGWRLAELPCLYDIDEPEDLRWLPADLLADLN